MSQKILWIENNPGLRMELGPALEENGFHITPTAVQSAVERYSTDAGGTALIIMENLPFAREELELAQRNFTSRMLPIILVTSQEGAAQAMGLLEFGVRDYLVKPVSAERLVAAVRNALDRAPHAPESAEHALPSGIGMDFLVIRSKTGELPRALEWIRRKTENVLGSMELERFLCFVNELLLNAHEHGNLRISGEEKERLLERGSFQREVENREKFIDARIEIALVVNGQKVMVNITDEGGGFDFQKYISLTRSDLAHKLFSPCGRGIFIVSHYFNSIEYSKGGRSVTLTKVAGAGGISE